MYGATNITIFWKTTW